MLPMHTIKTDNSACEINGFGSFRGVQNGINALRHVVMDQQVTAACRTYCYVQLPPPKITHSHHHAEHQQRQDGERRQQQAQQAHHGFSGTTIPCVLAAYRSASAWSTVT